MTDADRRAMLNKVPYVTLYFWIIKILATTVGETGADFLNMKLGLGLNLTSAIMTVALAIVLVIQMRSDRYVPWQYWLVVVFLSIVGTLITDTMTDELGISLYISTAVFSVALIVTFMFWHGIEHTLSIHEIDTPRREMFYWLAILFTFALGTAGGDLVSEKAGLGYLTAGLIFAGLIAAITAAYYLKLLGPVTAFWLAYILTRPLGASLGDLITQAPKDGGLGLGTMPVSGIFLVIIVALVIYLSRSGIDSPNRGRGPALASA
ncbi:hypothetical protein N0B51_14575 [Tsuneonella sp. YG55]|uniref:Membrane-anchored protein n=1 Tax=Tsuneonella litorea TaxID=2976475 RepID=A0A9X3AAT1_9SPHN|nr:hypothetical protein [Tsuneonella litorea]MCT2560205.1 hypothetical protein [Tsuneonella litorea]